MDNLTLLERLIESSPVSHSKCAELITLIRQMEFYSRFNAGRGDLYAQNIQEQVHAKEVV